MEQLGTLSELLTVRNCVILQLVKGVETGSSTKPNITVKANVTCLLSDTSNTTHLTSPLFPLSTFIFGKTLREVPFYMSRRERFIRGSPTFPSRGKVTS